MDRIPGRAKLTFIKRASIAGGLDTSSVEQGRCFSRLGWLAGCMTLLDKENLKGGYVATAACFLLALMCIAMSSSVRTPSV